MSSWRHATLLMVILIVAAALAPAASAGEETVRIGWLSQAVKRSLPLSYLDQPPQDEGIQGARLGIADNDTTGHFTGQSFILAEAIVPEDGDVAAVGIVADTCTGEKGKAGVGLPRRRAKGAEATVGSLKTR